MEFAPRGNVLVLRLALPPERVTVPNVVEPEVKITVPVGVVVGEVTVAVSVTDCPNVDGLREDVTVVDVTATLITWLKGAELVADCVSPLYVAVIESVPAGRLLRVSVATPPELSATVASVVVPFLNTTFPVGVIGPAEVTAAVNVTDCPKVDGLRDETSEVVVAYLLTTCFNPAEVLALNAESPA